MEEVVSSDAYDRVVSRTPDSIRDVVRDLVEVYSNDKADEDSEKVEKYLHRSRSEPCLAPASILPGINVSSIAVPGGFRRQYVSGNQVSSPEEPKNPSFLEGLLETNEVLLYEWIEELQDGECLQQSGNRMQFLDTSGKNRLNDRKLLSNRRAVLTIFKCFIATGFLFLPSGFKTAGLVAGTASLIGVGLVTICAILLVLHTRDYLALQDQCSSDSEALLERNDFSLSRNSTMPVGNLQIDSPSQTTPLLEMSDRTRSRFSVKKVKPTTYSNIGEMSMGKFGKYAVEFSTFFSQLGFCCVFLSFSGNLMHELVRTTEGLKSVPLYIWMICGLPIVVPLTWIRRLKYFAIPNMIATLIIFGGSLYVMMDSVAVVAAGEGEQNWSCSSSIKNTSTDSYLSQDKKYSSESGACFWINFETYPAFLGTAVYAFEGITMILPIYNSMRNKKALVPLIWKVLGGLTIIMSTFGAVSFYAFGSATKPIVLSNLPHQGRVVVSFLFIFVALFMFPLTIFPAANIVENTLSLPSQNSGKKWYKNLIRAVLSALCLIVSIGAGKSINKLVALIGAVFCVPLALVYPSLFYLYSGCAEYMNADMSTADRPWTASKVLAVAILVIGVTSTLMSSYYAVKDLFTN